MNDVNLTFTRRSNTLSNCFKTRTETLARYHFLSSFVSYSGSLYLLTLPQCCWTYLQFVNNNSNANRFRQKLLKILQTWMITFVLKTYDYVHGLAAANCSHWEELKLLVILYRFIKLFSSSMVVLKFIIFAAWSFSPAKSLFRPLENNARDQFATSENLKLVQRRWKKWFVLLDEYVPLRCTDSFWASTFSEMGPSNRYLSSFNMACNHVSSTLLFVSRSERPLSSHRLRS